MASFANYRGIMGEKREMLEVCFKCSFQAIKIEKERKFLTTFEGDISTEHKATICILRGKDRQYTSESEFLC